MNPTQTLRGRTGSPTGWLGKALERGRTKTEEAPVLDGHPVFRGVEEVCADRLRKARKLEAVKMEGNHWAVLPNDESDSGEVEYVNLQDSLGERCHCADFLYRCEDQRTLCKHILSALLASGHEGVVSLVQKQERDETIIQALRKDPV